MSGTLPAFPTPFIGRADEIAELGQLLDNPDCRLLTLVGLGGIGKTRLALALAEQLEGWFPDGVYFVPLQPLQSPDQIVSTTITTLSIEAGQKTRDQLLAWLRDKHLLLVLDNFEHLVEGVDLLIDMLEAAPDVKLLVTSREALRLRGEWLRHLHGLDYPDVDSAQTDSTYSAVEMFVERVHQQGIDLNIETQLPNIVHICQLVEGMPLALELAASWVKSLSCAAIVTELEQSSRILKSRTQDMPSQHRSMEIVFNRSWHLLTDEERAVLRGCSVFRGGWTREAAEQVTGANLSVLTSLVEKSLLRHDPETGRFDQHELLRQYAAEKLDQAPETRELVLDRHCDYYTEYLHQQERTIHLSNQADVLVELDNLRAAWMRAVEQRNLTALRRAAPSLHWLYHFQSWADEGAAMFFLAEEALREMPVTDESRFLLGMMRLFRCFYRLKQSGHTKYPPVDIESTLALWDGLEEQPEMGLPLSRAMIRLRWDNSDPQQIMAIAQKSLAFSRYYDDLPGEAIALVMLAVVSFAALGEFAEAWQLCEEALAIDRQIGFALNARWAEGLLGDIAIIQGRYNEAKDHCEASVAHHRAGGIRRGLDDHLFALASAALELGEDAAARTHFEESIVVALGQQHHEHVAMARAGLGILAAFQGDSNTAAQYYEEGHAYLRSVGMDALSYSKDLEGLGLLTLLLGHYPNALEHFEAIHLRYSEAGYRVPVMSARSRVGHALLGLGDETRAKPYLFGALREAAAMGAFQVLQEALLGIARLSIMPPTLAVELLALVCVHPASNRYTRTQAKRLLATMEFPVSPDEFTAAVERGQALTLEAAVALIEPFGPDSQISQSQANQRLADPLSQRELEVLELIASGLTNQQIADQLYVGVSTVKKHINHIYSKLDVTHRAEAVARARTANILS